ncbi:uncharacterized protein LY79DRAFT_83461 [Colletotrichum navitas]|uniref:Secreted protein n=1 Tax=Colletotrichum navitas TaxID=681940 RepID=A0AAD8V8E5_9PEZI|nr:uncharacterized protein LY79DRAFT_83461 [Colletotrichum navitas]KAK1596193.1 hypothetical protein LY79DRAFT_83461 [Colletotrichum navitas]
MWLGSVQSVLYCHLLSSLVDSVNLRVTSQLIGTILRPIISESSLTGGSDLPRPRLPDSTSSPGGSAEGSNRHNHPGLHYTLPRQRTSPILPSITSWARYFPTISRPLHIVPRKVRTHHTFDTRA